MSQRAMLSRWIPQALTPTRSRLIQPKCACGAGPCGCGGQRPSLAAGVTLPTQILGRTLPLSQPGDPYEREAGYLAQAFNNVYLDGGLSINYLGARAPAFVARLLELAPVRKIVYSSDGFGPVELHYLGARLWRNGVQRVLSGFVDDGDWSAADALRVVDLIARDNAARIYRLAPGRPASP